MTEKRPAPVARSGSTSRPARTLLGLVVVFAVLFGWIAIGSATSDARWSPKLALDLEGGTQIILQPQATTGTAKPTPDQIKEAVTIIRQRVDGSGVSEAQVTTQGANNIVVALPGTPSEKTLNLVKQSAELTFRPVLYVAAITPPTATPSVTPSAGASGAATPSESGTASPSASPSAKASSAAKNAQPDAKATNSKIVSQALMRPQAAATSASTTSTATSSADDPAAAQASAQADPSAAAADPSAAASAAATAADANPAAKGTPSDTAQVTEALGEQFSKLNCTAAEVNALKSVVSDPKKPMVTCNLNGTEKEILGPVEVRGSQISSASSGLATNQQGFSTGEWEVKLNFKSEGTKQFAAVTERLAKLTGAQNQFAIVLDGLVVSDPGVNERIPTGEASITGSFTQDTASTLASQLKFGALPISFEVKTSQTISAILGSEQLHRGLLAGVIGLILVVLYSLAQYRALGLVTVFSLVFAGTAVYGLVLLLSWQQDFRLSLPGVAGLIVSIGITADSFIVYFERVRDEVREGRPLRSAVETAWQRARRTILISDTVNFLAAVVLYILAVGGVRGFAFTLGLTTLVDVMIVFLFTKPAVTLLSRTSFFDGGHPLSGFSATQLGRAMPVYAGRGQVRPPSGQSIAERRAAQSGSAPPGVSEPGDPGPDGSAGTDSAAGSSSVRAGSGRDL